MVLSRSQRNITRLTGNGCVALLSDYLVEFSPPFPLTLYTRVEQYDTADLS